MTNPFLGEIRMVACDFPPVGWALCNGQLLSITKNTALFSILGTAYGGDGTSTFGLPNLQGSGPLNQGKGPQLADRRRGDVGGASTVTLTREEMPKHSHTPMCDGSGIGTTGPQVGAAWSGVLRGLSPAYQNGPADVPFTSFAVAPAPGGAAHDNMSPYLVINFIIALEGVTPPRS